MHLNIMLSCAGRQAPLVEAFVRALNGRGKVYVADINPFASALGAADIPLTNPPFTDPNFTNWCLSTCRKYQIGMWFSFLEDELAVLEGLRDALQEAGCVLIGSPADMIETGMDKRMYATHLEEYQIAVPATKTLLEVKEGCRMEGQEFVVKMRRGRGSCGLFQVRSQEALLATAESSNAPDSWIAQESIEGQIYCIDVINDLNRNFAACLIRKRLSMGMQETEVAETISDSRIENLARQLSLAMRHQGCMDVDVIEKNGTLYVIDLNLRFGGSHIFSLVAGANIPAALIAWRLGEQPEPEWLRHRDGEILSRYSTAIRLNAIT
jgi:carbamoyl-phosphate synthase large subunit